MLRSLTNWWDSVELWITQLDFVFQVALAIVILLPLCAGVATLADLASGVWDTHIGHRRSRRRRSGA